MAGALAAGEALGIEPAEAHVWFASATALSPRAPELSALLGDHERERMARFRHARDRERFAIRRGVLRVLLASYLGEQRPERLELDERCPRCGGRENAAIARLRSASRAEAFFRTWTRKEAFAKAVGEGLTLPLAEIEVSPGVEAPLSLPPRWAIQGPWSIVDALLAPGYAAAVAARAEGYRVCIAGWIGAW